MCETNFFLKKKKLKIDRDLAHTGARNLRLWNRPFDGGPVGPLCVCGATLTRLPSCVFDLSFVLPLSLSCSPPPLPPPS
jgi:hypothetical protein